MHPSDKGRQDELECVRSGAAACGAEEEWAVGVLLAYLADGHNFPSVGVEYGSGDSCYYTVNFSVQVNPDRNWEKRYALDSTLLQAIMTAVDNVLSA